MNINKDSFKIYVCGPTVYDFIHIGNLRPIISFDFLISILRYFNKKVDFLHNITDIDDKIINRALAENKSESEIANFYYLHYLEMLKIYNVFPPNMIIKVTDHLDKIINYISNLEQAGFTYYNQDGDLIFNTKKIENYGKVSGQILSKLYKNKDNKANNNDFVLWKKTKKGVVYNSSFGLGRPGWHTECSAMIFDYFNTQIDIHGGGNDLIFPHHENENAQHFALNKEDITKDWLRVGVININGQKMSKSLGNVILAKDFYQKYHPDVFRNILLTSSLSSPINITSELLTNHSNLILSYKKSYFNHLFNPQTVDKNKVDEVLNLFLSQNFSQANLIISQLLKTNQNSTLALIFQTLRFQFASLKASDEDIAMYNLWNQKRVAKLWSEADEIREKLWKKYIFY
ncbi:Cysteine--tRNA ligase [Mesomycoplasma conjunctivae]|uniref:Cysteine--tRNA ligase n=1 Tax=Mesomycoplasma conjunctivae (strain ATCC 25834 / NCTC 10147 / HRC/581) TaxID=572263 RepID=C5J5X6_MESCH|nr:cysteine--tRNA ligase [Mesomycoplasma conjunctivae]CAT04868.1 Cysteinyl-tRNA synthetase [Mesomycoplasma conjunctivae]VEU65946.1 Cysteine--tRNA ligase [Mesomycoplasma conjunctivae]